MLSSISGTSPTNVFAVGSNGSILHYSGIPCPACPTPTLAPTPTPTPSFWSFAIITDTHIGEGMADYGGTGWNDNPNSGQDYKDIPYCYIQPPSGAIICTNQSEPIPSVWNLKIAVGSMNTYKDLLNTKFVVIDGDLTDSAEMSEFGKAKAILNVLNTWNIPWVPLLGNHDVWPYTSSSEAPQTETHDSSGVLYGPDWYFNNEMNAITRKINFFNYHIFDILIRTIHMS